LAAVSATAAFIPVSTLSKVVASKASTGKLLSIDTSDRAHKVGAEIIGRVATEPGYRAQVEADPVGTLAEMGVTLPPEMQQQLLGSPTSLSKAMLGEEPPLSPQLDVMPIIIIYVLMNNPPVAVGGIAEPPDQAALPDKASSADSSGRHHTALAGGAAAAAAGIAGAGLYAKGRRRRAKAGTEVEGVEGGSDSAGVGSL
jgi:hypothetical protein